MKNQQQAEKEEQQRIKNLVLNYDLQQNEDQESKLSLDSDWRTNRGSTYALSI